MPWSQNYDPLGNATLSTILAAAPVVVLLSSIAWLRIRIHFAALVGLTVALLIALLVYRMPVPVPAAAATTFYGAAFGLFPIGWIILNRQILRFVFFHSIVLATLVGVLVFLQAYVSPFRLMVVESL